MKFEELLEYDTIYVQRLHSWESYYVLKNLKKAGRRIVYDMDDDIFSLTPDNPAFHVISRDNQQAAVACMNLADVVTTTTQVLANRLVQVLEQDVEMVVIPNALDTDDGWFPTERTGSLDGNKRIFWQGSATHGKDWEVCIEAIDRLMQEHFNVHLIILGFLPPVVIERLGLQHWSKRVQHLGFNDSETYFKLIHHIKADVGIAPLAPQGFNEAKSPIKWLEYTCIGMPTVASDMEPYSSVIEDGVTGYLVPPDTDAWYGRLKECLEKPVEHKQLIVDARKEAKEYFDIKTVASVWNAVLLPSSSETPATT
jgi:glycosyltransferase involved in cell wall biosynthesis